MLDGCACTTPVTQISDRASKFVSQSLRLLTNCYSFFLSEHFIYSLLSGCKEYFKKYNKNASERHCLPYHLAIDGHTEIRFKTTSIKLSVRVFDVTVVICAFLPEF